MQKNNKLNRWFWKWHIIAGLITLPIFFLLSVTGAIYLFKDKYENSAYKDIHTVTPNGTPINYAKLLDIANTASKKPVSKLVLPQSDSQAIQFVSGKRSGKHSVYVDPYKGEVTGGVSTQDTLMYTIRKLHGELLLGLPGTLVVELVGCWLFVLIITGIYVWWPQKKFTSGGFFTIRFNKGKRILYRDIHVIVGFWTSIVLLIILIGGMPWTEIFGAQYKRLQQWTNSGYPSTWMNAKSLKSESNGNPMTLDQMVTVAEAQSLSGKVTIKIPQSPTGVFSVSNRSLLLRDQTVKHFDQYSGDLIKEHTWSDVGSMMAARQVVMRLHQGEYGFINWIIVLISCIGFALASLAGLMSYLIRKRKGKWSLPKTPKDFHVGTLLLTTIILLGIIFPLFGGSLVLIWIIERVRNRNKTIPEVS